MIASFSSSATQTAPSPVVIAAAPTASSTRARLRMVAGATRSSSSPTIQSEPSPYAIGPQYSLGLGVSPDVRGSMREIALELAAHTASRPTASQPAPWSKPNAVDSPAFGRVQLRSTRSLPGSTRKTRPSEVPTQREPNAAARLRGVPATEKVETNLRVLALIREMVPAPSLEFDDPHPLVRRGDVGGRLADPDRGVQLPEAASTTPMESAGATRPAPRSRVAHEHDGENCDAERARRRRTGADRRGGVGVVARRPRTARGRAPRGLRRRTRCSSRTVRRVPSRALEPGCR